MVEDSGNDYFLVSCSARSPKSDKLEGAAAMEKVSYRY